ncbi:hypothetical protein [Frankia sp. AgW1.1]|uniref:hypothetical protein n=1 Tax=Frankia sp. AgW1.1 TaxID=1836971 RepID=UPI0019340F05|nr:hypothetical protein [Frankia sp. AgW1.1]MBL7488197.1 hypothetical protein [Frankia sp. AgW1.1]
MGATNALTVVDGTPTRGVIQRAGQYWQEMNVRWPDLPAVRDLGEIVVSARKALPAARTA